ncbi:lysylphosphatidylglycerol synthase transmembrane domain-containing protein [Bradyrhizobium sp.]|uniref:lysylphosphatidylglycerol synthase transmembrane domain-containing protein n=1 Tax=Bradyrhizobium sp. TaxID=376 RepID=UPI0025BCB1C0|nr:lysylphosphatidylglycerol synthase transmembrane domain-containing protein [Bradyrhizobium sp.]
MQLRSRQAVFFSAKLLLSIAVLVYIAGGLDLNQLKIQLLSVDPVMFLLALALVLLQTFLLTGRWELIMRALNVSLDWMGAWRILMISLWFNQVLPSSAGGDAVRIWLLRRRGVKWSQAVKGVAADRFTALLGLVILMVIGMPMLLSRVSNDAAILAIGGLTLAGAVGTALLLTLDRWPERLIARRPVASFVRFGSFVRHLLLHFSSREVLLGSALLIHLITTAAAYALAVGLRAQLSIFDAFILIPPVILLTAVPISISGWGVREGAMIACLALVGVPSEQALSISLLLGAISVIVGVMGGVIWLTSAERGSYAAAEPSDHSLDFALPQVDKASSRP